MKPSVRIVLILIGAVAVVAYVANYLPL